MKLQYYIVVILFLISIGGSSQTTFSEQAAAKNIDLAGQKDGGLTFADFNGDSYMDLLVNTNQNGVNFRSQLYYNTGPPLYEYKDVTLTHAAGLNNNYVVERCAVAGDLDNDGDIDFIRNSSWKFELYLNNGAGSGHTFGVGAGQDPNFELETSSTGEANPPNGIPNGMNTEGIGLFDYDNDGDLDIMIENHNWGIDIYENNVIPNGTFSLTHVTPGTTTALGLPQSATDGDYASVTDVNDDGYIDIVARKRDQEDFWLNNGDGTFKAAGWVDQQALNSNKGAVSLYDFDNDGDYDLMWTDNGTNQIWQQTGVGTGNFVATNEPALSSGTTIPDNIDGLACGDIDNDGDIDMFLGAGGGPSFLYLNVTPPGSTNLKFVRNNCNIAVNGNAEGAVFVDFDNDGDLDLYINVDKDDNQLWVNNLNNAEREDHLIVGIYENLDQLIPNRKAIGANIILKNCEGEVVSGIREVNGGNGHGTQDPSNVHFGLPLGSLENYIIEVHYPVINGTREIAQYNVIPDTLGIYQYLEITPQSQTSNPIANDDSGSMNLGTEQFDVLANDISTTGPIVITNIITQPSVGTATIVSSGTLIEYTNTTTFGTYTIDYEICQLDCKILCDTATLTIETIPCELSCSATEDSPVICFGESNGEATVTTNGGNGVNTYLWDNNETTATVTMLSEGYHTVDVEDSKGCTTTCGIYISQPDLLACSAWQITAVNCYGESDGVAELSSWGGTGNVDILWDNGETTIRATALDAGIHTVEITDVNDCKSSCTVTITEPTAALSCSTVQLTAVDCFGQANGRARVTAIGGNGEYTYLWDNGRTTRTANGLDAGVHTVVVTDSNSCTTSCTVTITGPSAPLTCTATEDNPVVCSGESNGEATVTSIGGNGGYTYLWDNGETTATATALDAGNHTVTVTDSKNCTTTCTVNITEPNAILSCTTVELTPVRCVGQSNGRARVTATGGNGGYTYLWDNGRTTRTANRFNAGIHTVTVTDNKNCTTTCTVTITEPSDSLTCTASEDNPVVCNGESNGEATVSPTGGNGGYTYLWDNGETTATATALDAGLHTVVVTDSKNCTTSCTVTINEPQILGCTVERLKYVECNCRANGSATVNVIGGNGGNDYLWSNGETTRTAIALDIGVHTVVVTDSKGCETSCQIEMEQDPECCHNVISNGFLRSFGKGN